MVQISMTQLFHNNANEAYITNKLGPPPYRCTGVQVYRCTGGQVDRWAVQVDRWAPVPPLSDPALLHLTDEVTVVSNLK